MTPTRSRHRSRPLTRVRDAATDGAARAAAHRALPICGYRPRCRAIRRVRPSSAAMFGVSRPSRSPISCTAPTMASSSIARPASTSCSIEVRKTPSSRASFIRSSPDWPMAQPMRAPTAAASAMPRSMKACTSGSARMTSVVSPVRAETGFIVMFPHNLYQTSRRMSALGSALKPASASAPHTAATRSERPPSGSPTIRRSPKL